MLQNIKDLLKVKDMIVQIKEQTEEYNKTISSLKTELNSLKNEIRDTKSNQAELLNYLKDSMGSIDDIKEELKKEVYEFNLLKSQMQGKILEKFEKELQNELNINLEKLKADNKNYEDARKELALVVNKTIVLGDELNKFAEIGKNLKKEDFMLTKFCNKIWDVDKEKLELMKKIDTLERLVSKIRRSSNERRY
jgi:chromosome segregation ATPase